jgi:hypothetical protein
VPTTVVARKEKAARRRLDIRDLDFNQVASAALFRRYAMKPIQNETGRMRDMDRDMDRDHRTVGRSWRMHPDDPDHYYDEDRPQRRVKICVEYENGDEYCHYR